MEDEMATTNELIVNLIERYHLLIRIRNDNAGHKNETLEDELLKCKIELSAIGVNVEGLDRQATK